MHHEPREGVSRRPVSFRYFPFLSVLLMNHLVFSGVLSAPGLAWREARHSNPLDKHCLLCLPKLHLDWSGSWRAAGLSKHRSCLFTARRVPALATATASWARLSCGLLAARR